MLEIKGVYKTFNPGSVNEKHALNGLDIVLNEGDFVTVIGGNGAGKSTFLNAVAGVWPVDAGKICIDGKDVTALPEYKRAKYLGRVFQDPMTGTAANMQIEENLAGAQRPPQGTSLGGNKGRTGKIPKFARFPRPRTGGQAHRKGRTALRRTEAGAHPRYGDPCQAEAAAP